MKLTEYFPAPATEEKIQDDSTEEVKIHNHPIDFKKF